MNKLTKLMVEHFNLRMKEEGSCLRYRESSKDGDTIAYNLVVEDKYISDEYGHIINITKEFEAIVRMFFKGYGVESTGFSNTVATIFAFEQ